MSISLGLDCVDCGPGLIGALLRWMTSVDGVNMVAMVCKLRYVGDCLWWKTLCTSPYLWWAGRDIKHSRGR